MNATEIKNVLDAHLKWLRDEEGGSRANLSHAYLSHADLRDANLSGANLRDANLSGADGIVSFGPVGKEKRIGYAWLDEDGKAVIMLGCHVGNLKDTVKAIQEKYGKKSTYEMLVRASVAELEGQVK